MSNHPDLVGILPILLENLESRPICDQHRKNPNFDICFEKYTRTPKRVKLIPRKRKYTVWNIKQNRVLVCENTQIKIGIKITLNLTNILEEIAEHKNNVSEHQNFIIFSGSMLPDPPWRLAPSALTWFVGYLKNTSRYYSKGWTVWLLKLENEKFTRWFSIFDLIIRRHCQQPTPKNPHPKEKLLALWVFRKAKKYWTNVKTTPNMVRVMGTWFEFLNDRHMIKNTKLDRFEHRTDICCDKLERIFLPPYIFIESRGGKWIFCNLGVWSWPNFREDRLYERKDA